MSHKRLFLIDGMSHIYRAYYAIRNLNNSRGLAVNAVFGFTSMLRKLIQDHQPEFIGVAFDLEGPTLRQEKFEAYKATRKPMPEDLVLQIPYIRRVCEVFRVPVIGFPGYEADDVIGTLAGKAVQSGLDAVLVTSDKDMLQLVSDRIVVLDTMKDDLVIDPEGVVKKLGVKPEQVADLLGLWGDASDNIPGAPGIGEKGAKELIQTYGTLENCLQNWENVKRKTYQESLRDNVDKIRLSHELATIHRDLPIELDLETLALSEPDRKAAFALFSELEFKSLTREFQDEEPVADVKAERLDSAQACRHLKKLAGEKRIFFALYFRDGSLSRKVADLVCVSGAEGPQAILDLKDSAVAQAWNELLQNSKLSKVCWDAKLCSLAQEPRGIEPFIGSDDVMMMAFLVSAHLGEYTLHRWAMDQLQMALPEEKPPRGVLQWPADQKGEDLLAKQCSAVMRLFSLLDPRIDEMGLRELYRDIELPLIPILGEMERTGIRVEPVMLKKLSTVMEEQLASLRFKIYASAGSEFNINSPKQLGEVLFERLNLPAGRKMKKTGGYSTDQTVLEELAGNYEIARLILDFRQISKLKSTYVDALPQLIHPRTGRVHTSYNQTGAATGRLSSSDPNLQNIPIRTEVGRLIRAAFVPEKGSLFVSADYSQVELRVLAHLTEDEVLTEAFLSNQDVHERTAIEVFGEAARSNPQEYRRRAKVINFGIVYGLSAFGLAQKLGIGREEAQAFIDAYFERYKGVRQWLDRTIEEARRTGRVKTMFGRIRAIPDIHAKDFNARQFAERTAINSPIQGTAADIMKIAMIRVHRALQREGSSAKMLLQVHDELVLEVPEKEAGAAGTIVKREMQGAADLRVPLLVDVNIADNWKDAK
jgi:DNA polymerase I